MQGLNADDKRELTLDLWVTYCEMHCFIFPYDDRFIEVLIAAAVFRVGTDNSVDDDS